MPNIRRSQIYLKELCRVQQTALHVRKIQAKELKHVIHTDSKKETSIPREMGTTCTRESEGQERRQEVSNEAPSIRYGGKVLEQLIVKLREA